jgi:hypothetical protein
MKNSSKILTIQYLLKNPNLNHINKKSNKNLKIINTQKESLSNLNISLKVILKVIHIPKKSNLIIKITNKKVLVKPIANVVKNQSILDKL